MAGHLQDEVHRRSLEDPESFWASQAERLHWHKKPTSVLRRSTKVVREKNSSSGGGSGGGGGGGGGATPTATTAVEHPHWEWFGGGEISTCYNCVDRHVEAGRGDLAAVHYDSPATGARRTITYAELLGEVEAAAAALREEAGVGRGDVVLVYMPMVPAALVGVLAAGRLGAAHAVVFGGFAPAALARRIEAARPVAVLTASCGVEGAKGPVDYRPLVREAVRLSRHKPARVLVWQREQLRWRGLDRAAGERDWGRLVRGCRARRVRVPCVPVAAHEPLYIIYTSGTTGAPKGVVRDAGGHAVGLALSTSYLFGISGPGDVIFTAR